MQPYERIEKLLTYLQMSANMLAKEINLPGGRPQRLYDIKKKGLGISADLARKIRAAYPNISYEWLTKGVGDMIVKNEHASIEENMDSDDYKDKRIAELEGLVNDLKADKNRLEKDKEDLRESRDKWEAQAVKWEKKFNDLYALRSEHAKKRESNLESSDKEGPTRPTEEVAGE